MKPSSHFVRYNAQDYAERGFLEVSGRVRDMAQKPRHWQITATARTQNPGNRRDGQAPFQVPDASEMQAVRVVRAG